ncbi:MAG: DinB family protein [Gemmatimonadota bacterium]
MTDLVYRAADAVENADAYVAALLAALGTSDPLKILSDTPDTIRRGTAGLSASQLAQAEKPGKWSLVRLVQHLSDSELVGAFRYRMVLAHDRPAIPGYDQDRWVERLHRADDDFAQSFDDFAMYRQANLCLLERTTPMERQRVMLHAERGEESLLQMMRLYAGHDLVHLRQLDRIRLSVLSSPE